VIFIYKAEEAEEEALVYDLDTVLGFPCSFDEYSRKAIREETGFVDGYHRYAVCLMSVLRGIIF